VELGVKLTSEQGPNVSHVLALLFFLVSAGFVWRSFYGMRIGAQRAAATEAEAA